MKQKEPEELFEITMPNKENNLKEDYYETNLKDSICDEMISKNLEARENGDDDRAKINLTEGNNNKNKNKAFDNRDEGCC